MNYEYRLESQGKEVAWMLIHWAAIKSIPGDTSWENANSVQSCDLGKVKGYFDKCV